MSNANYLFEVPNNAEGKFFIHLAKNSAAKGVRFKLLGRKLNEHEDVPLAHAERIRVYAETDVYTAFFGKERSVPFGPKDKEIESKALSRQLKRRRG